MTVRALFLVLANWLALVGLWVSFLRLALAMAVKILALTSSDLFKPTYSNYSLLFHSKVTDVVFNFRSPFMNSSFTSYGFGYSEAVF